MPEDSDPQTRVGMKVIAISATGMVVSLGLCGAGFYLTRNIHDGATPTLDIIGFFGLAVSLVGVFVGTLIAASEFLQSRANKDKK